MKRKNPRGRKNPRRAFMSEWLILGHTLVQNGRNVTVPEAGLSARFRSFQAAEKRVAGLLCGAFLEYEEHKRHLSKLQALEVAWDHLDENPDHYTKQCRLDRLRRRVARAKGARINEPTRILVKV